MGTKTKQTQPETPYEIQGRDNFQTPKYAIELLLPYIPKSVKNILEPCAGMGKIVQVLKNKYNVFGRDINPNFEWNKINFLTENEDYSKFDALITNPPFSVKYKMIQKAIEINIPFGFLIPFDMCGYLVETIDTYNCKCLVPQRRVNFLTPNILINIYKFQLKKHIEKQTNQKFKNYFSIPDGLKEEYKDFIHQYKSIDEVPQNILAKYSSSDFHSFWLTRYFDVPDRLTFCDLSLDQIKNNIW